MENHIPQIGDRYKPVYNSSYGDLAEIVFIKDKQVWLKFSQKKTSVGKQTTDTICPLEYITNPANMVWIKPKEEIYRNTYNYGRITNSYSYFRTKTEADEQVNGTYFKGQKRFIEADE